MKVTNKASFAVVALGWHETLGRGLPVTILPGETGEVSGPYVGPLDDGECYLAFTGEITCHEGKDCPEGMHISPTEPLHTSQDACGNSGVSIYHHEHLP